MNTRIRPLATRLSVTLTMACLLLTALVTGAPTERVDARFGRRDRGALTLEQAIVTAVLSAAAIALGVVIVNAVLSHSSSIR